VELDELEEAVDHFAGRDPAIFADPESIERLERLLVRVEAAVTAAAGAFDAVGAWAPSGARNAPAWLRSQCRLPSHEASRQVRRGRQLRELPACAEAWSKGDIGAAQFDVIAALRRPVTEAALERDEEMLVRQAQKLTFKDFVRVVHYWEQHADPDGTEEDAMEKRARRDVYLQESISGMYLGAMTLDPISGAIVSGELERLEQAAYEADWAEAKERLGRDPRADELARTSAQRRADALVEMATRSGSCPENARRPEPLFSVLVGYETLHGRICQLAQGGVVSPGSLLPWLDQALVERAVFSPGQRVEVGITARLFTGATRRAIELRDQTCTHPFCDQPAERCQIDHIVPYGEGGLTTQENGRVLCSFHNRLRNQRPPPGG
jgi:hypothetical protein